MSRVDVAKATWATLSAYWKGLSALAAFVAWLLASATPKFGFVTKLTFGGFLARTYWPELVALIAAGLAVFLLGRRLGLTSRRTITEKVVRQRQTLIAASGVPIADRFAGLLVLIVVGAGCLTFAWKQVGLMFEAEQVFAATRLMNWFGDDLHRVAARQINRGDYETAVRTLRLQSSELGEIEEANTASMVADALERRISNVQSLREQIQGRMRGAGIVRSDILMLASLQAMLPPFELGGSSAQSIPGGDMVRAYRQALHDVKARCDGGTIAGTSAQTIGMAAAALGFARWPSLLFGPTEDLAQRARVLCEIAARRETSDLDRLHANAFSVSAASVRHDWRIAAEGATVTPPIMVARSFVRALDTSLKRAVGWSPLNTLVSAMVDGEAERQPQRQLIAPWEASVLAVAGEPTESVQDYSAFVPVTLVASATQRSQEAFGRIHRSKDGTLLTLCIPSDVSLTVDGYSLQIREDGRLQVKEAEDCGDGAREAGSRRSLDATMLVAIGRFIAMGDSGRSVGAPAGMRGALCRAMTAGVKERARHLVGSAIRLCPIDAAASRLTEASTE